MQDPPNAIEMLTAVSTLLRAEILPRLSGRAAYQVRVAANALDIVGRELTHAPSANANEARRLENIIGTHGELDALNWQLCQRIAAGDLTLQTAGLAEHLWSTTLDKLAIDQPNYATYLRVLREADPAAPAQE